MSAQLAHLAKQGIGVCVWCVGSGCRRSPVYIPADETIALFGQVTCEQARWKLRCHACGARGRDGRIQVLPSTMDVSDVQRGRPAGTSERAAAAGRAEAERRERLACAANGWNWDQVYGARMGWSRQLTSP